MNLRPYQLEAKAMVFAKLRESQSTLVEMATGLGKTVLFGHVAHEWDGRVLVIAHRDELIRQAAEKIQAITGDYVAVEMARDRADLWGAKFVVGSVQTLSRAKRRERFGRDFFSLIIVDEGHHAAAVTYREVLEYFGSAKRLFVTATPKRKDQVALSSVCETVAYQYGIEPAIEDGWLVPVKQKVVKVEGLDFSKARTVGDDFNAADLERILSEEAHIHEMVAAAHEETLGKQALWFCASVSHAKLCGAVLGRYAGNDAVRFLSGDTPRDERRAAVEAYKAGTVRHLLNCALFLEGFDAPSTSAIVMGRPTKSLALYTQVLGRGTRPLPGLVEGVLEAAARKHVIACSSKPHMTVIDFAGNAGRHKIIQATDVLGGKHEALTREYARATLEQEGCAADIEEALERAKAELELEFEENERRRAIVAKPTYRTHEVSPFARQYTPGVKIVDGSAPDMCTDKQAGKICHLSRETGIGKWTFQSAKELTKRQASGVISKLLGRGTNEHQGLG